MARRGMVGEIKTGHALQESLSGEVRVEGEMGCC